MGRKARETRATVVRFFVGGRWDPPSASEQRAKVGIKVEHGLKKGIFAFGLLSLAGIELGPNSADPKEKEKITIAQKKGKNHQGFQTFLSKKKTDI
jgi:hypothetical protein